MLEMSASRRAEQLLHRKKKDKSPIAGSLSLSCEGMTLDQQSHFGQTYGVVWSFSHWRRTLLADVCE